MIEIGASSLLYFAHNLHLFFLLLNLDVKWGFRCLVNPSSLVLVVCLVGILSSRSCEWRLIHFSTAQRFCISIDCWWVKSSDEIEVYFVWYVTPADCTVGMNSLYAHIRLPLRLKFCSDYVQRIVVTRCIAICIGWILEKKTVGTRWKILQ